MPQTIRCLVGEEVYDARRRRVAKVVKEDGFYITVLYGTTPEDTEYRKVTSVYFQKHFRIIHKEGEDPKQRHRRRVLLPEGEAGVGPELFSIFCTIVKELANQDLQFTTTKDNKFHVIWYNGYNIFRILIRPRHICVYCHTMSLCPANKARVTRQYPREHRHALGSIFVFTSEAQVPLMRSVITDGLFYRQIVIKDDDM